MKIRANKLAQPQSRRGHWAEHGQSRSGSNGQSRLRISRTRSLGLLGVMLLGLGLWLGILGVIWEIFEIVH